MKFLALALTICFVGSKFLKNIYVFIYIKLNSNFLHIAVFCGSCDNIAGSWKIKDSDSDNFDAVLIEMGVSSFWRTIARTADPTVTFAVDGKVWTFTTESSVKTSVEVFTEGVEREAETIDGRSLLSTVTCENGHLKQVQKDIEDGSVLANIDRSLLANGDLLANVVSGEAEANRVYARA